MLPAYTYYSLEFQSACFSTNHPKEPDMAIASRTEEKLLVCFQGMMERYLLIEGREGGPNLYLIGPDDPREGITEKIVRRLNRSDES